MNKEQSRSPSCLSERERVEKEIKRENRGRRIVRLKTLFSIFLVCSTSTVFAVENGAMITPTGTLDFAAGILPPVTDVGAVGVRINFERADQLRNNSGNRSVVTPDLDVNAVTPVFVKMTNVDVLGGKWGFGTVLPLLDQHLKLNIPTPVGSIAQSGSARGIGDIQLIPALIQWNPSNGFFTNAVFLVQAPTGQYDRDRTINPGVNHWTFQPSCAFTYIAVFGLEVSSRFQFNFNTTNMATDYKSGIEYEQDFAVGQHIGPWTVGVGGYFLLQVTDDSAPGLTNGNRARQLALGPVISFVAPEWHLPMVYLHVYKEFASRNLAQGTQVALRVGWSF
ncbi:transporter [Burkholderia cepacia]|uniref:SphA family protein n=1 Tax=Burkholderia cepacia TaxID=292 RepID=UPI001F31EEEA|nr:transporter [Burkholderia cepacia]MCE4124395.1 transporter [Burkholderia cepacia]